MNTEANEKNDLLKTALEMADKRLYFEIEHYWKRAAYFWVFIALAFTGYFFVLEKHGSDSNYYIYKLAISSVGLVFSIAWFHVNKASKFWQNVWQCKVAYIENKLYQPLACKVPDTSQSYDVPAELMFQLHKNHNENRDKTVEEKALDRLKSAHRPSLTSINQDISCFIVWVWIALVLTSSLDYFWVWIALVWTSLLDGSWSAIPKIFHLLIGILVLSVMVLFICMIGLGSRRHKREPDGDKQKPDGFWSAILNFFQKNLHLITGILVLSVMGWFMLDC